MEVAYLYTKVRSDFGRHCGFKDAETTMLCSVLPTDEYDESYVRMQPCTAQLDTTPHMSEHEANTDRTVTKNTSMRHSEGGWPKDVDASEPTDMNRFRKKVEKDDAYKGAAKELSQVISQCMKQNNTMNIYEEYFSKDDGDFSGEPPSANGLAVFCDPCETKRAATSMNWHPESPTKIAVSYSVMNFQDPRIMSGNLSCKSYIWDILNPNVPERELDPPSPLCCLRFNPKTTDTLIGGSYNGLITYYDLRKSIAKPTETSKLDESHHDPVYDCFWISSKTGNLAASISTDGAMLWWDTRKMEAPTDKLQLFPDIKDPSLTLSGCSMDYNGEAGATKYLVGTEQGTVLAINLRNRKQNNGLAVYDTGPGKHHGPITCIQRNPTHTKYFMTVGDWTARIWQEDLKTPIMTTKYHPAYLTGGCWSTTRPGVFYVTRMDGVVDVWDYNYRQNQEAFSVKLGEVPLSSIAVSPGSGRHVAVGDINGTVTLLEVSENLAALQPNEKLNISLMFEREAAQAKNLELRERDLRRAKALAAEAAAKPPSDAESTKEAKMDDLLRKVDADFLAMIKEAEDDAGTSITEADAPVGEF